MNFDCLSNNYQQSIIVPYNYKLVQEEMLMDEGPTSFSSLEVNEKEAEEDLNRLITLKADSTLTQKTDEKVESLFKKRVKKVRKRPHEESEHKIEEDTDEETHQRLREFKKPKISNETNVSTPRAKASAKATTHTVVQPSQERWPFSQGKDNRSVFSCAMPPSSVPYQPSDLCKSFKEDSLARLRFSQKTISATLSDETFLFENPKDYQGITLFDILRRDKWKLGAKNKINVVLMPDGLYTSMDNRRLAVAKTINAISHSFEVLATPHHHSEQAPPDFLNRISVLNPPVGAITANTFGHAITSRISQSRPDLSEQYGFKDYPVVLTGLGGRKQKKITIENDKVYLRS